MNLINGDCLIELKKIKDKSVDFVYCDLPYGETGCKWDCLIDLDKLWIELLRVARHNRVAFVFSCSTKFGYHIIKANEKMFKMDLVWKKRNVSGGIYSKYRPMKNHEMLYFFYKKAPKYNRNKYHKRIKEITDFDKTKGTGDFGFHNDIGGRFDFNGNHFYPPNPVSIFESSKVFTGKRNHQTEKPLDLMEFLLKYWTDEGDVVLDATMGSGTMGVSCKILNRQFIGIEKDPDIFKTAVSRIDYAKYLINDL